VLNKSIIYLKHIQFLTSLDFGKKTTFNSLLSTCNNLYQAYDSNLSSRIVFLDISKAFDRVNHTRLSFKIKELGIVGPLSNLSSCYLFQRSQGSVRSLLLFLIYVNDTAKNNPSFLFLRKTPLYIILPNVLFTCTGHFLTNFPPYTTGQRFWNITSNLSKTAVVTISNQRNIHSPLFFNNTHL